LGLSVSDCVRLPLERLLPRMRGQSPVEADERLKRIMDQVSQPELLAWLQRNEERARQLTPSRLRNSFHAGRGWPAGNRGVGRMIELLERKRELIGRVHAIAGSEYLALLEQFVGLVYDKIRVEHLIAQIISRRKFSLDRSA